MTILLDASGSPVQVFDITKLEQSFRLDLSPSETGEAVAVALKFNNEPSAYALSKASYLEPAAGPLRSPKLELPGDEYRLTVRVEAGGVRAAADFRVRNRDSTLDGFSIQPWKY